MSRFSSSAAGPRPGSQPGPAHLDLRDPLVIDTRELGRRPGAMRRVRRVVPASDDLSTRVIGVSAGSDIGLDLRLEAVMEGVLVSGTASVRLVGECGRCLEPLAGGLDVEIQELYTYPGHAYPADELPEVVDDLLDLAPSVRDAVVLGLPQLPLCRPSCAGLCVACGARLDEVGPDHGHDRPDPRWAALSGFNESLQPYQNKEN